MAGTSSFAGVVVGSGGAATAYVCDGRRTALWFRGRVAGRTFTLRATSGERFRVRLRAGRATGSVTFRGRQRPFAAAAARKPAGLYRAVQTVGGKRYVGGWVVLPDGRQRGAVRVGSRLVAAPLVHPAAAGGVRVAGVRLAPRYLKSS